MQHLNCRFDHLIVILSVANIICGQKLEKVEFRSPKLTEEETYSLHIPAHLKCDSCLLIAYQIKEKFDKASQNRMKSLRESQVIDIMDAVCTRSYMEYGLKEVNGQNRISGPGIETSSVGGMVQMGGRLPGRLRDLCNSYVGDLEEIEIYRGYLNHGGNVTNYLCYGDEGRNACKMIKDEL